MLFIYYYSIKTRDNFFRVTTVENSLSHTYFGINQTIFSFIKAQRLNHLVIGYAAKIESTYMKIL